MPWLLLVEKGVGHLAGNAAQVTGTVVYFDLEVFYGLVDFAELLAHQGQGVVDGFEQQGYAPQKPASGECDPHGAHSEHIVQDVEGIEHTTSV